MSDMNEICCTEPKKKFCDNLTGKKYLKFIFFMYEVWNYENCNSNFGTFSKTF